MWAVGHSWAASSLYWTVSDHAHLDCRHLMPIAHQFGALLGGIGLLLLGRRLMTEGPRLAAGVALCKVPARSTRTRWRALGSRHHADGWCSQRAR